MALRDLIREIHRTYPTLRPGDFADILSSMWVDIVRQVRLPTAPSIFEVRAEELARKRMPPGVAKSSAFMTSEVYRAVAEAQGRLDGGPQPSPVGPRFGELRSTAVQRIDGGSSATVAGPVFPPAIQETDLVEPISSHEALRMRGLGDLRRVEFTIDPALLERMSKDRGLLRFFASIESRCRTFVFKHAARLHFAIQESADVEETEWKRIVLSVRPPELALEEVLKLWDSLDDEVRELLRRVIDSTPEPEATSLRELSEDLYIEMRFH